MGRRDLDWKTLGALVIAGAWLGRWLTRPRYDFRGKVVLLTGGSRGLGLELARVLARKGARLALLARDDEELGRARDALGSTGAEVEIFACDVRFQDQVQRVVREVVERFGQVDVLINNAGVIQVGPHETMRVSDYQEAMDTHFFGPLFLVQAVLPAMRERRQGRIVNVASVGGKIPTPHLLPYVASKFALVGWSEGLHAELRRDGIVVTTVCPGLTRTGSPRHVAVKGRHQIEYALFKVLDSLPYVSMNAGDAAEDIVHGVELGKPELILTGRARNGARLQGLAPGLVSELMALGTRLLPRPRSPEDHERWTGAESESGLSRSFVTGLTQRAEAENNERPATP
ncbi:MAG TPA: SDR family NAD(P)-dependent oxidoreductase [Myxococcaceae bacterium]|nr:SDR family NAD(P)-dependent oxidoreductase [Myxococcaceae bacterium]